MSKKSNNFKVIYISVLIIVCFTILLTIKVLLLSPISKNDMEEEFLKSKDILLSVEKYLEQQEYDKIYITSTTKKAEMFVSTNEEELGKIINIFDESISNKITELFEKYRYNVITKKSKAIYFQRWSNRDYGRGIVYLIDGEYPSNKLITKLEPLSEDNWYFYEEK